MIVVDKAIEWVQSSDKKIRLNAATIIGFYLTSDTIINEKYMKPLSRFMTLLSDTDADLKNNVIYFLLKLKNKVDLMLYRAIIFQTIKEERTQVNVLSLLDIILTYKKLDFFELQELRSLLIGLINSFFQDDSS